jgi:hypothetical protein
VFEAKEPCGHVSGRRLGDGCALAGAVALTVGIAALAGSDPMALCVLPALVLPLLIVVRGYPGERILAAMSGARNGRRRPASSSAPRSVATRACVPRGGLLLARSLAVRPPPGSALTAT